MPKMIASFATSPMRMYPIKSATRYSSTFRATSIGMNGPNSVILSSELTPDVNWSDDRR